MELDLISPHVSLLRTALQVLKVRGSAPDVEIIRPLLYSNSPGVAKAALAALDALDPGAAVAEGRKAIAGSNLHPETRRVLDVYLRQRQQD